MKLKSLFVMAALAVGTVFAIDAFYSPAAEAG